MDILGCIGNHCNVGYSKDIISGEARWVLEIYFPFANLPAPIAFFHNLF